MLHFATYLFVGSERPEHPLRPQLIQEYFAARAWEAKLSGDDLRYWPDGWLDPTGWGGNCHPAGRDSAGHGAAATGS
ncbi:MAG: hypothetical protein R3A10_13075 [Caldilineaceae bacterium]